MLTGPQGKHRLHRNPWGRTQRTGGKKRTKVSLLVDERGVLPSLVVCGANRPEVTQLGPLLEAMVAPELRPVHELQLCVDKGYKGAPANGAKCDQNHTPPVPVAEQDRTMVLKDPDHRPRRWIVEGAPSWFKRFRKLLVHYEKTAASFLALLYLERQICSRRLGVIYG